MVGGEGECWMQDAHQEFAHTVDHVVRNEKNTETEAGYSFLRGLSAVPQDSDVLVIDGDIVLEDHILDAIVTHSAPNVALVKASETKIGVNNGACVSLDGRQITRCGFDVGTNYVYSGVMKLSAPVVETLANLDPAEYATEQLATLIDEIADTNTLVSYTVEPDEARSPVVDRTLDGYEGAGNTTLERRKGRLTKREHSEPKKLRDEIDSLRTAAARHPDYFPELLDVSFFADKPTYEMPDYTERGYTPLDDVLRSKPDTETLSRVVEPPLRFILDTFGHRTEPLPGLYKNAFLPKIERRYAEITPETPRIGPVATVDTLTVNTTEIAGLSTVTAMLERPEFVGWAEPRYMTEIHGDFKPDNILVDEDTGNFLLVDPRGLSEIGTGTQDQLYDIAKFLTSTDGYYTAFKHGEFTVSVTTNSPPTVTYSITDSAETLQQTSERVFSLVDSLSKDLADSWRGRLKLLTGLLLIANAPVHTNGENRMATAELIRGLELFNEGFATFQSHVDVRGDVINVNRGDDLAVARELFE